MTRAWALDVAAHGITVNSVAPGMIATELFEKVIPAGTDRRRAREERIPVRRLGRPDELAHAVMFFLSEGSSYVTGQTLFVCGGASLGGVPA